MAASPNAGANGNGGIEPAEGVRFEDLPSGGKKAAPAEPEIGAAQGADGRIHVGAIRYGLAAIKNVGESAMQASIPARSMKP